MQFRMSPGGRMSKSRRSRPELPPSSVTVTTAAISTAGRPASALSFATRACFFSPDNSVDNPVPPPIDTIRSGALSRILSAGETRVRIGMTPSDAPGSHEGRGNRSTAFFWLFVFFFFVNGNRVQVFGFEYLTAVEAAYIVDAIPAVKKLGSLVLTSLHSEVTPILDRASLVSSAESRSGRLGCELPVK